VTARGRALAGTVLLLVVAAIVAWRVQGGRVPDRHDPWAPLSLSEPPGWTTSWKLARASRDPAACRAALAQAPWRVAAVPDRVGDDGCAIVDAVRIDAMRMRVGRPFTLSCPAALSLAMWETHALLPAAERHVGARPAAIEHFGSYACRNVGRRATGERSRHATADALDVAGFAFDGGRRIAVARDWRRPDAAGAFLRDVHRGACRWFDVVLGPDHDAAHADHLHFDRGPRRACR
jgi:hypothetical protein